MEWPLFITRAIHPKHLAVVGVFVDCHSLDVCQALHSYQGPFTVCGSECCAYLMTAAGAMLVRVFYYHIADHAFFVSCQYALDCEALATYGVLGAGAFTDVDHLGYSCVT